MTKFIELRSVKSDYTARNFIVSNETTELVSININSIEYIGLPKAAEGHITIARGYIRTKNCDFRVVETYKEIMELIGKANAVNS